MGKNGEYVPVNRRCSMPRLTEGFLNKFGIVSSTLKEVRRI
jgi:hypothetical protein